MARPLQGKPIHACHSPALVQKALHLMLVRPMLIGGEDGPGMPCAQPVDQKQLLLVGDGLLITRRLAHTVVLWKYGQVEAASSDGATHKTAGQRTRFMLQWHAVHTTGVAAACNFPLPLLADKRNGQKQERCTLKAPCKSRSHLHRQLALMLQQAKCHDRCDAALLRGCHALQHSCSRIRRYGRYLAGRKFEQAKAVFATRWTLQGVRCLAITLGPSFMWGNAHCNGVRGYSAHLQLHVSAGRNSIRISRCAYSRRRLLGPLVCPAGSSQGW